ARVTGLCVFNDNAAGSASATLSHRIHTSGVEGLCTCCRSQPVALPPCRVEFSASPSAPGVPAGAVWSLKTKGSLCQIDRHPSQQQASAWDRQQRKEQHGTAHSDRRRRRLPVGGSSLQLRKGGLSGGKHQ